MQTEFNKHPFFTAAASRRTPGAMLMIVSLAPTASWINVNILLKEITSECPVTFRCTGFKLMSLPVEAATV